VDALLLIGRILFAVLFISSGVMGHLVARAQLTGYAASKGFPMAGPAVVVSGIGIILSGSKTLIRVMPRCARTHE
jgi:putative oxidoreductase